MPVLCWLAVLLAAACLHGGGATPPTSNVIAAWESAQSSEVLAAAVEVLELPVTSRPQHVPQLPPAVALTSPSVQRTQTLTEPVIQCAPGTLLRRDEESRFEGSRAVSAPRYIGTSNSSNNPVTSTDVKVPPQRRLKWPGKGRPPPMLASHEHIVPDSVFGIGTDWTWSSVVDAFAPRILRSINENKSSFSRGQGRRRQLQTANLFGDIFEYAYYFVKVLIGTPPQVQTVIVDTGSSLLGFPCNYCESCGTHLGSWFNFSASSSSHWLPCSSRVCYSGICEAVPHAPGASNVCHYYQRYSEGSSIQGAYFSDLVALSNREAVNPAVRFDYIGCHQGETNLFVTQRANGIMGISYPKNGNQQTIMDALFQSPGVDTSVFSLCIADRGGRLDVGGYNSSLHRPSKWAARNHKHRLLAVAQSVLHDRAHRFLSAVNELPSPLLAGGAVASQPGPWTLRRLLPDTALGRKSLRNAPLPRVANGSRASKDPQIFGGFGTPRDLASNPRSSNLGRALNVADFLAKNKEAISSIQTAPSVVWVPIKSKTTYEIELQSLELKVEPRLAAILEMVPGSIDLSTSAVVDSGTTYSYFPEGVFTTIMKLFGEVCRTDSSLDCTSTSGEATCWTVDDIKSFDRFPVFLFHLSDGGILEWTARSYLHNRGTDNQWCTAVEKSARKSLIFGLSFFKNKNVIFDRQRDLLGFAEANCPDVDFDEFHGEFDTVQKNPNLVPAVPSSNPIVETTRSVQQTTAHNSSRLSQWRDPTLLRAGQVSAVLASIGFGTAVVVFTLGRIVAVCVRQRRDPTNYQRVVGAGDYQANVPDVPDLSLQLDDVNDPQFCGDLVLAQLPEWSAARHAALPLRQESQPLYSIDNDFERQLEALETEIIDFEENAAARHG